MTVNLVGPYVNNSSSKVIANIIAIIYLFMGLTTVK
jgi:hypothetical protein